MKLLIYLRTHWIYCRVDRILHYAFASLFGRITSLNILYLNFVHKKRSFRLKLSLNIVTTMHNLSYWNWHLAINLLTRHADECIQGYHQFRCISMKFKQSGKVECIHCIQCNFFVLKLRLYLKSEYFQEVKQSSLINFVFPFLKEKGSIFKQMY